MMFSIVLAARGSARRLRAGASGGAASVRAERSTGASGRALLALTVIRILLREFRRDRIRSGPITQTAPACLDDISIHNSHFCIENYRKIRLFHALEDRRTCISILAPNG